MDFASMPVPGIVTVAGETIKVAVDVAGPVVTVTDIPVQMGVRNLEISSSLLPGAPTELDRWRSHLAECSIAAGDWAHAFGRTGPKVCWSVSATCALTALFAEITEP
jgi:hypothetical protein